MSSDALPIALTEFREAARILEKIDAMDESIRRLSDAMSGSEFFESVGELILAEMKVGLGIDLKDFPLAPGSDRLGSVVVLAVFVEFLERRAAMVEALGMVVAPPDPPALCELMRGGVAGCIDV